MDEVGEDDPCPLLRECIVHAKPGTEGKHFVSKEERDAWKKEFSARSK